MTERIITDIICMAQEAGALVSPGISASDVTFSPAALERFYNLAAAAERDRNTKLLYQMHERAAAQHNYYKHAAIEINRKAEVLKCT